MMLKLKTKNPKTKKGKKNNIEKTGSPNNK